MMKILSRLYRAVEYLKRCADGLRDIRENLHLIAASGISMERWCDMKVREYEDGERGIKKVIRETVDRAKDIWDMDYADSSDGLYPNRMQIGRRVGIAPHDLGLKSWIFDKVLQPGYKNINLNLMIDHNISEDVFLIIQGYRVRNVGAYFLGIFTCLAECRLPFVPFGPCWKKEEDGYYYYYELPVVLSPKSNIQVLCVSAIESRDMREISLIGQVIAKRSYLVNYSESDNDVGKTCSVRQSE